MAESRINLSVRNDRITVPGSTVLTLQGSSVTSLILLHSGMAEILDYPGSIDGKTDQEILDGSLRVGIFKGESVCGVSGFFGSEADRWTIRTMSECQISSLPITSDEALATMQSNKGLSLQVLRAMQRRIESAIYLFANYKSLWKRLASIADSVALACDWNKVLGGKSSQAAPALNAASRLEQSLGDYSRTLRAAAASRQVSLLPDWDQNWFLDGIKFALDRFAEYDNLEIEGIVDYSQYLFIKRLVNRSDAVLTALFDKDEPSQYYVFQFLDRSLDKVLLTNLKIAGAIRDLAARVYSKNGWADQVFGRMGQGDQGKLAVFLHFFWKFSVPFHSEIQKMLDINLSKLYPAFGRLQQFRTEPLSLEGGAGEGPGPGSALAAGDTAGPATKTPSAKPSDAFVASLQDYPKRLAQYGELGPDFEDQFLATLKEFRLLPDKLATEPQALAIRTKLGTLYWKLYEACFLKAIDGSLKEPLPGYMLHFGLVDKSLVTEEELAHLERFWNEALSVDHPVPVMTLPYFLEKIYVGEVNPSTSEMGESFAELLRRQDKMTPKERLATRIYDNKPEDRVGYEISVIASNLAGLLSGSRKRSVPVLCTENIQGNIARNFQDPPDVSSFVDSLRQRDFMVFCREVVCKHRFGNDLVIKEVLPNIVLYPCGGTRSMMWQEFDGVKKDSAARIYLPLFLAEKRDETIVTLLAHLRWEMSKTIAGHNWMDPVEGGLTGAYYDYIAYYKKNPNLSLAHKDTLKDFIGRTRSDKDRFAEDYASWVIHEFDSKIRLNPVARDIFYRYCPFRKEMREEMAKKGLYSDLEVKYQNRARKDILSLETRMKKFEKSNEPIPEDMEAYMSLLTS